jgi:hypothetical protein
VQILAVVGVGDATAGSHRLQQRVDRTDRREHRARHRRDVAQARDVEECLVVALGQPEPPRGLVTALGLEDAARRLLLEPLARVALVDARGFRQLRRGQRPTVGKRPVEAEPVSDMNREEIEGADRVHEEPLDERVASRGGVANRSHARTS